MDKKLSFIVHDLKKQFLHSFFDEGDGSFVSYHGCKYLIVENMFVCICDSIL